MDRKPTTNLGLVIEINPASISKHFPYDEIEYVDISSVDTGSFSGSNRMPLAEAPSRAKRLVEHGDTILATVRPNLRSFLFIKNPPENMVVSTGFAVLHPGNKIDARFLYYTVIDQKFTDYLTANAKGSAYPAVDTETIARAEISFPTLEIQQKIAVILSAYDDLIENNLRRIKILEEMAQSLYREWFVKFRFPGHQKYPPPLGEGKGEGPCRLVNSPLGKIPEGWDTTSIDELCEYISRGISPQYKEDIDCRVINQRCIRDNRLELELARGNTKQVPADKFVRFGDVLINSTGVGTLGRVAQIYRELKGYTVDSHVTIVRPVAGVNLDYFGLSMILLQPHFERLGTGATGQTELNRVSIAETKLIAPPFPIQKKFGGIASPLRSLAEILRLKNHTLRQTRDLLLPKLISGELDVSELDITIPEAEA